MHTKVKVMKNTVLTGLFLTISLFGWAQNQTTRPFPIYLEVGYGQNTTELNDNYSASLLYQTKSTIFIAELELLDGGSIFNLDGNIGIGAGHSFDLNNDRVRLDAYGQVEFYARGTGLATGIHPAVRVQNSPLKFGLDVEGRFAGPYKGIGLMGTIGIGDFR